MSICSFWYGWLLKFFLILHFFHANLDPLWTNERKKHYYFTLRCWFLAWRITHFVFTSDLWITFLSLVVHVSLIELCGAWYFFMLDLSYRYQKIQEHPDVCWRLSARYMMTLRCFSDCCPAFLIHQLFNNLRRGMCAFSAESLFFFMIYLLIVPVVLIRGVCFWSLTWVSF